MTETQLERAAELLRRCAAAGMESVCMGPEDRALLNKMLHKLYNDGALVLAGAPGHLAVPTPLAELLDVLLTAKPNRNTKLGKALAKWQSAGCPEPAEPEPVLDEDRLEAGAYVLRYVRSEATPHRVHVPLDLGPYSEHTEVIMVAPDGRHYRVQIMEDGSLKIRPGGRALSRLLVAPLNRDTVQVWHASDYAPTVELRGEVLHHAPAWTCRLFKASLRGPHAEGTAEHLDVAYHVAAAQWRSNPELDGDPPAKDLVDGNGKRSRQVQFFRSSIPRRT